ncbi:MAG: hypothetical protein ACI4O4_01645, partial [Candidatus Ventricola sp.]
MKKVLALLLVTVMLLCSMAFAESAESQIVTLDPPVKMYVLSRGLRLRSEMDFENDENILRVLSQNDAVLVDSIIDDVWAHVTYEMPGDEQNIEGYVWYEYLGENQQRTKSADKSAGNSAAKDDAGTVVTMSREEYIALRVMTDKGLTEALAALDEAFGECAEKAGYDFDALYIDGVFGCGYDSVTGEITFYDPTLTDEEKEEIAKEINGYLNGENADDATVVIEIGYADEETDDVFVEKVEMTKDEYAQFIALLELEEQQAAYEELVADVIAKAGAEYDENHGNVVAPTVEPDEDEESELETE